MSVDIDYSLEWKKTFCAYAPFIAYVYKEKMRAA